MPDEAPFEPERVIAQLNAAGVRYVVVGGLAVGAHGVIRATRDLDLVPAPDTSNADLLARALAAIGGRHPIESDLSAKNLTAPRSLKVLTRHGEVHVLNRMPGTPVFEELERRRIAVEIEPEVVAPICSLSHLRQMKRASERPRDEVDLIELDALHGPDD